MNILVIDIGTSGMRGSFYTEKGERKGGKQVKYHTLACTGGGMEQPAEDWENALLQIIRSVVEAAEEPPDAVALTAQRSAVIPVDRTGRALMNAVMWQDTRNREICEELSAYNGLIFRRSGAKVNTVFSGGKMKWIKENKADIYKKTYKFLTVSEYLIHRMTGEYNTDYTYGSRSNLMNLRTFEWDSELLELFGIDRDMLCRLKKPGETSGYITAEYAALSGLRQGTPVISAGGDQQCAMLGLGAYKEGTVSIVTGTGAFLETSCSEIPESLKPDMICNASAVAGKYILETSVLTCCAAFDWFCDNFFDSEKTGYDEINRRLEKIYDRDGECIVLPFFQGRSTPDWNAGAKGVIYGVTLGSGKEEILKGILEGICMEINNNIELLGQYVRISGACISGGLTKSSIFNRMQADVYGLPLLYLTDCEAASCGAFMVSAKSLGIVGDLEEAFALVNGEEERQVIEPDRERHLLYERKRRKMNQLYRQIYGQGVKPWNKYNE